MNPSSIMLKVMQNPKKGSYIDPKCYQCKYRRDVPGNAHISCAKPCDKVTGDPHGIQSGWFMYPLLFDPTWMTTLCSTFESAESVSLAVSEAVSPETV